jgi:hypothetical protein
MYDSEQFIPPDPSIHERFVFIQREPYEYGLSDDVVFRDVAPVAGVGGIMPVIPHHPVIVHLESIAGAFLAVDEDLTVLHRQVIQFIIPDDPFIKGEVIHGKVNG